MLLFFFVFFINLSCMYILFHAMFKKLKKIKIHCTWTSFRVISVSYYLLIKSTNLKQKIMFCILFPMYTFEISEDNKNAADMCFLGCFFSFFDFFFFFLIFKN